MRADTLDASRAISDDETDGPGFPGGSLSLRQRLDRVPRNRNSGISS